MLVRLGSATIDQPDGCGATSMHCAAEEGEANVIATLVWLGSAALNQPDDGGETPLAKAIRENHVSAAEMLVAAGASLPSIAVLPKSMKHLNKLPDQRILKLRRRMYFLRTLLDLLLVQPARIVESTRRQLQPSECPANGPQQEMDA